MAKRFKYYRAKSKNQTTKREGKVIFESTEPNYMQIEDVDKKVAEQTGHDPRLDPWIEREVFKE